MKVSHYRVRANVASIEELGDSYPWRAAGRGENHMINGFHATWHSKDADKVREFCAEVLNLDSVDAGHGWLIFALPPAELGIHPTAGEPHHEFYLMCDDIHETVKELQAKNVKFAHPAKDVGWGLLTTIEVPGGGQLGLYQPKHPTAHKLKS
jgi:hypothetical protein